MVDATATLFAADGDRTDPYRVYRELRDTDPVHRDPASETWLVTRHADVQTVLRHPDVWSNDHRKARTHHRWRETMGIPEAADELFSNVLLFMDPPDHTRIRNLVGKAFTPKRVQALRPRVESILDGLLEPLLAAGEGDLLSELAYPFPVTVICELLGVPVADRDLFRNRTRELAVILEWELGPEQLMGAASAAMAFASYFLPLFEERRREPRDDLVSALVAAEEQGDVLSPAELLTTCILLFTAGHETTMNLIGNGLLALLRHPDQLARLRDPSIVRNAVDELLRYDSPVQLTARTALVDAEVGGRTIPAGDQAVALLGAANRDPDVFEAPDRLDLGRANANHHVSFGAGHHFCLGAALARLEGEVAFPRLLGAADLELAGEPQWRPTATLRGLSALPARLSRRR